MGELLCPEQKWRRSVIRGWNGGDTGGETGRCGGGKTAAWSEIKKINCKKMVLGNKILGHIRNVLHCFVIRGWLNLMHSIPKQIFSIFP